MASHKYYYTPKNTKAAVCSRTHKACLITGGDSGIGRSVVAILMGREGADVSFVHLSEEEADARKTVKKIEKSQTQGT
jgi:NAD(P)-dependent dehydrogenase (short-subunit alcohol dehydrogenase family)